MMIDDGNDGQMLFGDLGGLKLPDICLTGEENPEKTSPRKLVPTGDRTRASCLTGAAHSGGLEARISRPLSFNFDNAFSTTFSTGDLGGQGITSILDQTALCPQESYTAGTVLIDRDNVAGRFGGTHSPNYVNIAPNPSSYKFSQEHLHHSEAHRPRMTR